MADIPDKFLDGFERGEFPAAAADDWLKDHPDDARDIERYMDAGLSEEWAFAAQDQDMPHPSEWDHVHLQRDADGSWDAVITSGDETYTIDAADSDETAADNIWADFWFHVIDYWDIDVDKDVEYGEP